MSQEHFVYYRVVEPTPSLRPSVLAMQRAVCEHHPQLQARLLSRSDERGGETWMETYAQPGGVDETLLAEIEALAALTVLPHIIGGRHIETFTPCAS